MARKKACKTCKMLFDGDNCPICKSGQSVTNWKGRLFILSKEKSELGKRINVPGEGEFAIKVT